MPLLTSGGATVNSNGRVGAPSVSRHYSSLPWSAGEATFPVEMSDSELTPHKLGLREAPRDADQVLRDFIVAYESFPVLWDRAHPNYKNKNYRNVAYDKLLAILTRSKPGSSREDVKRKINTLRCNYRKELRKIEISKRHAGEVYQPTSWVFYALHFLGELEDQESSQDQDEIPSEERVKDEEFEEQSPPAVPVAAISQPRIFLKKRRTTEYLERKNELLKRSFLEQPRQSSDNMPTIAKLWGEKLLALDPQQRAFAEKAVNDVLFEASQGTLHRHSVKINEEPKFGAALTQNSHIQPQLPTSSGASMVE